MERKSKYPPGPPCECHDVSQRWSKSSKHKGGGYWRCVVKEGEYRVGQSNRKVHRRWYRRNILRKAQYNALYYADRRLVVLKERANA